MCGPNAQNGNRLQVSVCLPCTLIQWHSSNSPAFVKVAIENVPLPERDSGFYPTLVALYCAQKGLGAEAPFEPLESVCEKMITLKIALL